MAATDAITPMLLSTFGLQRKILRCIEYELFELTICEFDESVEERSDFHIGGVMVDRCDLRSIPLKVIILNY